MVSAANRIEPYFHDTASDPPISKRDLLTMLRDIGFPQLHQRVTTLQTALDDTEALLTATENECLEKDAIIRELKARLGGTGGLSAAGAAATSHMNHGHSQGNAGDAEGGGSRSGSGGSGGASGNGINGGGSKLKTGFKGFSLHQSKVSGLKSHISHVHDSIACCKTRVQRSLEQMPRCQTLPRSQSQRHTWPGSSHYPLTEKDRDASHHRASSDTKHRSIIIVDKSFGTSSSVTTSHDNLANTSFKSIPKSSSAPQFLRPLSFNPRSHSSKPASIRRF